VDKPSTQQQAGQQVTRTTCILSAKHFGIPARSSQTAITLWDASHYAQSSRHGN